MVSSKLTSLSRALSKVEPDKTACVLKDCSIEIAFLKVHSVSDCIREVRPYNIKEHVNNRNLMLVTVLDSWYILDLEEVNR